MIHNDIYWINQTKYLMSIDSYTEGLIWTKKILMIFFSFLLLMIGIPGNFLTLVVLRRRPMKDYVLSFYFGSLCFFNIVALVIRIPRFMIEALIEDDFINYNTYLCGIVVWLDLTLVSITSWHIVVVTACRLYNVLTKVKRRWPVKLHSYALLSACSLCGMVIYLTQLEGMVYEKENGKFRRCYVRRNSYGAWLEFAILVVLPLAALCTMNGIIAYFRCSNQPSIVQFMQNIRGTRKHLSLLVTLSTCQLIVTVVPMEVFLLFKHDILRVDTLIEKIRAEFIVTGSLMLLYVNNASNFLLYCCFGRRFRNQMMLILGPLFLPCCPEWFDKRRSSDTSGTMTNKKSQLPKNTKRSQISVSIQTKSPSWFSGNRSQNVESSV